MMPEIAAPPVTRKPRIALMGEFSAGKSTLANILMRQALSRVQITATQMPPVWYVHGDGPAIRIGLDGTETEIGRDRLSEAVVADTRAIRVPAEADILEACDLIDMPGSSDPNITGDLWQRMLPMVDGVLWCTPATQAWRQSEAALWEEASEPLQRHSLLLLTRIDKILTDVDRQRLLRRVRAEAGGQFRAILPVSLTAGEAAGEDPDLLAASGMAAVLEGLLDILGALEGGPLRVLPDPADAAPPPAAAEPAPARRAEDLRPAPVATAPLAAATEGAEVRSLIRPRRVMPSGGSRGPRPRPAADAGGSLI